MMVMKTQPYLSPVLREVIQNLEYKPGWMFELNCRIERDGSGGWSFNIISYTRDSVREGMRRTLFPFLIPAASYNESSWLAWCLDCIGKVEEHERNEFFKYKGVRVFAPHHGNGENPFLTWFIGDWMTAQKSPGDD